ncbi:MAG: cell wall-binding repeat-containing protein, partial [Chitinophagales bacterium]|nr:cell wall-binding repeat-containing protein [Chitinophagales bacterium]
AIINALGWDYYGKSNADAFLNYIAKVRNTSADKVVFADLTGTELMCYGYAKAMDDYSNVSEALQILELAKEKMPDSYTVNLIHAVISGQYEFDANWCGIWQVTQKVLNNKSLRRDMKTAAIQSVVDYMILYKSYCA